MFFLVNGVIYPFLFIIKVIINSKIIQNQRHLYKNIIIRQFLILLFKNMSILLTDEC